MRSPWALVFLTVSGLGNSVAVASTEFVAFAIRDGIMVHSTTNETSRVVATLSRNQKVKVIGGQPQVCCGRWGMGRVSLRQKSSARLVRWSNEAARVLNLR